jgi:hypothetical protein
MVGSFVIGPAEDLMLQGGADASIWLVAGATYDVIALAVATGLAVFKPDRPFRLADKGRRRTVDSQAQSLDLLRGRDGSTCVVHDRHVEALSHADDRCALSDAGGEPRVIPFNHSELEPGRY